MRERVTTKVELTSEDRARFFKWKAYRVVDLEVEGRFPDVEATITIEGPDGRSEQTASVGCGPVHALDNAFRKALRLFYPAIDNVELLDYKVAEVNGVHGTAGLVNVNLTLTDKRFVWETESTSDNVIRASFQALIDGIIYKLILQERETQA